MANLVDYVKTVWENGKTALNAARMNNMEQGTSNCATQINKLGDSVSQLYVTGVNDVDNPPDCVMFSTDVNPKGLPNDFGSNSVLVIQQNPGMKYSAQLAISFSGRIALRVRRDSMDWQNWKYLTPQ